MANDIGIEDGGGEKVLARLLEDEMRESFIDYSMSVIVQRALPDVRDGLKPVHRRILYAMLREGNLSNRRYSKCAGVVGEVLKKYHPHGDQAVYDALGVLTDKRLVRRIQPAGSAALFDPRVGDNHHHLICRSCGKAVDVDCAVGDAPCLTAAADSGFEIDEAEVIYWGTCPECRNGST